MKNSVPRKLALALAGAVPTQAAAVAAASDPFEDARSLHLLSRAAFGPNAESLEEVRRLGREQWLAAQLAPEAIADPDLEQKLSIYPALSMSSAELMASYPQQTPDAPAGIGPPQRVPVEVAAALVTRAVHAKAQLREVLTDFWFNHFNVSAQNGFVRLAVVAYLRDAIRPNALGRFEDLLRATAESPAMLYELDNYLSAAPGSRGPASGINENYARELLELHTLGVDGGYSQADVIEVARAFTGWTFTRPRTGSVDFVFVPRIHDPGPKQILGTTVPSGEQSEGLTVLHLLATHPATAQHLARKLLQRLVTDDPPQDLIDRTADVFIATDGHIGWTVASILFSDAFYDPLFRANKAKSPLEVMASALRAVDADVGLGVDAARRIGDLGQPLLRAPAPTGWPETAAEILSPGGMVTRFQVAYLVANDRIEGARVPAHQWPDIVSLWGTDGLARYLLGRLPSDTTRQALARAADDGAEPGLLAAMVLASPEFQLQ